MCQVFNGYGKLSKTELFQNYKNPLSILFAGIDKDVDVFGVSRIGIKCDSKSTDDAVFALCLFNKLKNSS